MRGVGVGTKTDRAANAYGADQNVTRLKPGIRFRAGATRHARTANVSRKWPSEESGKDSEIHKSTGDLFDYVNGGRDAWVAKIEAIRLADVTPERINKWRVAFVKRAGDNPLKQRRARITCNSLMRQAKSRFAPGLLEHVAMHKPQTLPFGGVASCRTESA